MQSGLRVKSILDKLPYDTYQSLLDCRLPLFLVCMTAYMSEQCAEPKELTKHVPACQLKGHPRANFWFSSNDVGLLRTGLASSFPFITLYSIGSRKLSFLSVRLSGSIRYGCRQIAVSWPGHTSSDRITSTLIVLPNQGRSQLYSSIINNTTSKSLMLLVF